MRSSDLEIPVHVADVLNAQGLGTVLFDLLTEQEAADWANVFDIALLAGA